MVIEGRDIMNRIADLLNTGNAVFLKVDLYNWLPKGIDYHKRHVYHETLIVGNDISKKSFYILDDDVTGYSKHIVTYDFVSNA